jgi:hypothetical protein
MNDDRIDELMAEATRGYNAPGPVPREEIWARIQAARREERLAAAPARVSRRRWMWPGLGVAAAAVLAVGIAVGRRIERAERAERADRAAPRAPTHVASTATPAPRGDSADARASNPPSALPARDSLLDRIHQETRATARRATELAAVARDTGESQHAAGGPRGESLSLAYRLVMLQHIAGSEAMITSFRASARAGGVDAQTAQWARELLGTTRLLESSPAADDPTMRRLLQDLDLVIAQIVQYASHGSTNPEELDLIERSIQRRGIMIKLRSTTPLALNAGT